MIINCTKRTKKLLIVQLMFGLFQLVLTPTMWISIYSLRIFEKHYIPCLVTFFK